MSRYKAALIHFSLSILVAAMAAALLLGLWYPPPYFQAGGGGRLLLLVAGVDVTLGPLLTLIVFDRRKPELKRDLTIIVAVQLVALIYGFSVMLQSRPAFLVAAVDRFIVVSANQLEPDDLAEARNQDWRGLSWTGPVLVAAERPAANSDRNDLVFSALSGKDVEKFPRYYVDYRQEVPKLLTRAQPVSRLRSLNPENVGTIDAWLRRHQRAEGSIVWLPIVARMGDLVMLMDRESGEPLEAVELRPW
jgi:hypothetical protein